MSRKAFSKRDLTALLTKFGGKCQHCAGKIEEGRIGLEWDHILAIKRGGEDSLDNLQPLCIRCHRLKTKDDVKVIAKTTRVQQKHLGIKKRSTFACSKDSKWKKKLDGSVVRR